MNIAFFHIGDFLDIANLFCSSAKKSFGQRKLKLIQISDKDTPKCLHADEIARFDGADISMFSRMQSYRLLLQQLNEPIAFFDTDILILRAFELNFSKGPILCERIFNANKLIEGDSEIILPGRKLYFPENKNKKWKEVYPFVGCFFADSNPKFLAAAINIYKMLPTKYLEWYGDQVALREASKKFNISTIKEDKIACYPEHYRQNQSAAALHFKGIERKKYMKSFYQRFHAANSPQSSFKGSYRSNPSKKGDD